MTSITLPDSAGNLNSHRLSEPRILEYPDPGEALPRVTYSAAHVAADPLADNDPWLDVAIDWEATLGFRRYLWGLGLGVAEAMDTAQRGMGLDWPGALDLIRWSLDAARDFSGDALIACGAGTDHLDPSPKLEIADVVGAYEDQISAVEDAGGRIILMASRALAAAAKSPDDYALVYDRILSQVGEPVIIHWLGEMFDPQLAGYWGHGDHGAAMDVCLDIIERNSSSVDGIKVSLLSADMEITMRRRLPEGVRMYTGDDFNYPSLIEGDEQGFSDALLGIFDPIAPAASAALKALGDGNHVLYNEILEPTVPLARHIFKAPTRFYKTGVVLMAYLNGHQDHFAMLGGQQSARSIVHLAQLFRLADIAGLFGDPDLAADRMKGVLSVYGIEN